MKNEVKKQVIVFALTFIGVVAFGVLALQTLGFEGQRYSFLIGAVLGIINAAALSLSWKKVLEKKSMGLAGGVIAFKYPILAFVIYEILKSKEVHAGWFLIGMGTVLPTALISTLFWSIKTSKIKNSISLKIDG